MNNCLIRVLHGIQKHVCDSWFHSSRVLCCVSDGWATCTLVIAGVSSSSNTVNLNTGTTGAPQNRSCSPSGAYVTCSGTNAAASSSLTRLPIPNPIQTPIQPRPRPLLPHPPPLSAAEGVRPSRVSFIGNKGLDPNALTSDLKLLSLCLFGTSALLEKITHHYIIDIASFYLDSNTNCDHMSYNDRSQTGFISRLVCVCSLHALGVCVISLESCDQRTIAQWLMK